MSMIEQRLSELRRRIDEVEPEAALRAMGEGALLVDIRETGEIAGGSPRGALPVVRGFLEMRIAQLAPAHDTPLLVLCASGARSLLAADSLQAMGYSRVASVKGGFTAWRQRGLAFEIPVQLSDAERRRYARHLSIPEVGEAGQLKLKAAKVLLIGAGGLGSPAALYLAAAGVGTIGLVDDDVVDSSNLQRQIAHTEERVGSRKVDSAKTALLALNAALDVRTHVLRIDAGNVEQTLAGYDIIVDGTDNFAARYLINDACVKLGLPNVHAAIFRFEGYLTVYAPARHGGPCYRCSYPNAPPADLAPSCADAGVLGVLPGVMGVLQAVEAIKLILDIGKPLVGRVLSYDALGAEFSEYEVEPDRACQVCGPDAQEITYHDLGAACAMQESAA
jgi:molybdopterin/thiamine biosynthesis adenylyltransferase/rhodanese-related sulfurtransferase